MRKQPEYMYLHGTISHYHSTLHTPRMMIKDAQKAAATIKHVQCSTYLLLYLVVKVVLAHAHAHAHATNSFHASRPLHQLFQENREC